MKKTLLITFMALATLNSYAQKVIDGTFALLKDEKFVTVAWDFSKTVFEKKFNEKEWADIHTPAEWEEAKKEAMEKILEEANGKLENATVYLVDATTYKEKTNYTIIITPKTLDKKGNNLSNYVLRKNANSEEVAVIEIKGDGGHFGSLSNLLGDGYEEAARKLGKHIRNCLKVSGQIGF